MNQIPTTAPMTKPISPNTRIVPVLIANTEKKVGLDDLLAVNGGSDGEENLRLVPTEYRTWSRSRYSEDNSDSLFVKNLVDCFCSPGCLIIP